jgi:hypothetical protein
VNLRRNLLLGLRDFLDVGRRSHAGLGLALRRVRGATATTAAAASAPALGARLAGILFTVVCQLGEG